MANLRNSRRKSLLSALFLTLHIFLSSIEDVHGVTHNANGIVLSELTSYFKGSIIKYADASSGGTATCPAGTKIIWGHTIMYNHGDGGNNDCMETKNSVCTVGSTSCTVSACAGKRTGARAEFTVGRVLILCGKEIIPGSHLVSTQSQSGGPARASCSENEKVVFGIKYMFPWLYNNCPDISGYNCVWGSSFCEQPITPASWNNCIRTLHVTNVLCAPARYSDALAEYGSMPTALRGESMRCNDAQDVTSLSGLNVGPRSLMLFGTSAALSDNYGGNDVPNLTAINQICGYDTSTCSISGFNTAGMDRFGGIAVCVPRIEIESTKQPTNQPTKQPTSKPTKKPTNKPTTQPTTQSTNQQTILPSQQSTNQPSKYQTRQPSNQPTNQTTAFVPPTTSPTLTTTIETTEGMPTIVYVAAGVAVLALMTGITVKKRRARSSSSTSRFKDVKPIFKLDKHTSMASPFSVLGGAKTSFASTTLASNGSWNGDSFASSEASFKTFLNATASPSMNTDSRQSTMSMNMGRELTDSVLRPTSHGHL